MATAAEERAAEAAAAEAEKEKAARAAEREAKERAEAREVEKEHKAGQPLRSGWSWKLGRPQPYMKIKDAEKYQEEALEQRGIVAGPTV